MGLADSCGVPFVQEVFSTRVAVKRFVCLSTDERNIGQGPADANASAGPCFVCRRAAIPRARRGTPL